MISNRAIAKKNTGGFPEELCLTKTTKRQPAAQHRKVKSTAVPWMTGSLGWSGMLPMFLKKGSCCTKPC